LLPVYIWLFMGNIAIELAIGSHLLPAFFGLIVTPLILAWLTERLTEKHPRAQTGGLAWVAARAVAGIGGVSYCRLPGQPGDRQWRPAVFGARGFVLYLVAAATIGKGLSELFGFTPTIGRTFTFSFGTRNSFVMLPLALSLPEPWRAAIVVIVFQSLVELFGMVAYLRWLPRLIRHSD